MNPRKPVAVPPPKGRRVRITTALSAVTGVVGHVSPTTVVVGGQSIRRSRVTNWRFA